MIDGLIKRHIDPWWETLARPLVRLGLTANAITLTGLVLVALNAAAFLWHQSLPVFGALILVSFAADSLDGAVARLRNSSSHFGSYLDAMVDRYQELVTLMALAFVTGQWAAITLGLAGGFITSYAKARTAIEIRISNNDWPDLMERQERTFYLSGLLILSPWLGETWFSAGIWLYAGLTHFSALQRMNRARRLLKK